MPAPAWLAPAAAGVLKYYNASANPQTCLGFDLNSGTSEQPAVCVQWPGTDYSCTFTFSPSTKPCRKAKDKCDVTEYCECEVILCHHSVLLSWSCCFWITCSVEPLHLVAGSGLRHSRRCSRHE